MKIEDNKMKISTTTGSHANFLGEKNAIISLAKAGFDALDYSMFFHIGYSETMNGKKSDFFSRPKEEILDYYRDLKKTADMCGIEFGQIHAPYPSYSTNLDANKTIFELLELSIEVSEVLGSKYDVIHPAFTPKRIYDEYAEETKAINMDMYGRLIPTAKKCGVKICIENMWGWDNKKEKICPAVCSKAEEMNDFIDTLNDMAGEKIFVACLDVGHSNLTDDTPANMIKILGERLEVLHIHDTDKTDDLHTIPYLGNINWDETFKALKEINYKGNFSFEAGTFFEIFGKDFLCQTGRFMFELGKTFVEKYSL